MEPILGQIALFPYNRIPKGWYKCDGQLVAIHMNTALFSLIGNSFGGDARANFALPKIPPIKIGDGEVIYCIAHQGIFPSTD